MLTEPGDWIIRDAQGECSHSTPERFERAYERLDEDEAELERQAESKP